MLNITAQRSAAGAKSYFSKSDYYSEGQELVGRWGGRGATLLGLFGEVGKPAFEALCDNRHPDTGLPLTALTRGERRVGYDFTWSAPKSVSVVHALTGDERIVQAFRDSVDATMREMEAEVQARVRRDGAQADRTTGNLVWAEFVHLTSRPVGGLPCPQLHAHVFAMNATYDREESRWKAGQFGKLKHDAYYWQAVQQARLARSLQGLGYGVRRTKDAFEIVGVPEPTLRKFSLRTAVIDRAAERLGITDPARKAQLAATTREAKAAGVPYPDLVGRWDAMLTPDERGAIAAARGPTATMPSRDADHLDYATRHLFERTSVVTERRLLAEALKHGLGEVTPEGVRAAAAAAPLLRDVQDQESWVTTPQVLAEERRMLAFAAGGRGTCRPLVSAPVRFADARLNPGQRAAVEHVLTSPDRVLIVRGVAGTGKTTLTREAVAHIEAAGKPVVMLAPSAQASRGVLRDEGFAAADTLARFLIDEKMQAAAQGGVIWLDESGLVGCRTMAALFEVADRIDARIVLAGDKNQLGSVERGAPLRVLEEMAGLKAAEVTDIRRQTGEYRNVAGLLSRGETAAAVARLDALGWVRQTPELDPHGRLAAEYVAAVSRGESLLVVSPTHAEGAAVTAAVRHQLRESGLLGTDEREFARLVPLHWTEAERADAGRYGGDEVLQFHRNAGPFRAGDRRTAAEVLPSLNMSVANAFAVYERSSVRLAAGDAVRVTANGKTLARGGAAAHRLNNGATYAVKGFSRAGDVELSNGWVVAKDGGHLAHGYVSTGQAAQGRTVDRVLVAHSAASAPASGRENFYVAVTRGRRSATIFTDDKAALIDAVARADHRPSATELVAARDAAVAVAARRAAEHAARRDRRRERTQAKRVPERDVRQRDRHREMSYAR